MEESLRFCMVTTFYPPYNFGGDGIFIYRLTNELAQRGHRVDVIHCEDAYSLFRNGQIGGEYPNHPNVTVHKLKSWAGFVSPLLTQQTGMPVLKRQQLKSIIEDNQYDVIHYHNMSLIGITALQYGDAIKLYTLHEHWLVCPMHVLWKFNREVCTKKQCTLCTTAGKRPPQLWRQTGLLERALGYVDRFIAPSQFTLDKHHELGMDIPITHLPHFLPKPKETTASAEHEVSFSGRPGFLFVGRLEKIKGVQKLIPIFKQRPGYDLLIAGDGEYESTLKELAGEATNIKFLGRLSHTALQSLYPRATAVVVPSLCLETFGMIILEAFAMKTPVIVNNLGALPEMVQKSSGGLIYNDESQLAAAVDRLANEPRLRAELGERGYAAYLKYWTEDVHMKNYLDLIRGLQSKRHSNSEALLLSN